MTKPMMKTAIVLMANHGINAFIPPQTPTSVTQPTTTQRNAAIGDDRRRAIAESNPFDPIIAGSSDNIPYYEESAAPRGECGRPQTFGGPSTKKGFVNESALNDNPFYASFRSKPTEVEVVPDAPDFQPPEPMAELLPEMMPDLEEKELVIESAMEIFHEAEPMAQSFYASPELSELSSSSPSPPSPSAPETSTASSTVDYFVNGKKKTVKVMVETKITRINKQ